MNLIQNLVLSAVGGAAIAALSNPRRTAIAATRLKNEAETAASSYRFKNNVRNAEKDVSAAEMKTAAEFRNRVNGLNKAAHTRYKNHQDMSILGVAGVAALSGIGGALIGIMRNSKKAGSLAWQSGKKAVGTKEDFLRSYRGSTKRADELLAKQYNKRLYANRVNQIIGKYKPRGANTTAESRPNASVNHADAVLAALNAIKNTGAAGERFQTAINETAAKGSKVLNGKAYISSGIIPAADELRAAVQKLKSTFGVFNSIISKLDLSADDYSNKIENAKRNTKNEEAEKEFSAALNKFHAGLNSILAGKMNMSLFSWLFGRKGNPNQHFRRTPGKYVKETRNIKYQKWNEPKPKDTAKKTEVSQKKFELLCTYFWKNLSMKVYREYTINIPPIDNVISLPSKNQIQSKDWTTEWLKKFYNVAANVLERKDITPVNIGLYSIFDKFQSEVLALYDNVKTMSSFKREPRKYERLKRPIYYRQQDSDSPAPKITENTAGTVTTTSRLSSQEIQELQEELGTLLRLRKRDKTAGYDADIERIKNKLGIKDMSILDSLFRIFQRETPYEKSRRLLRELYDETHKAYPDAKKVQTIRKNMEKVFATAKPQNTVKINLE